MYHSLKRAGFFHSRNRWENVLLVAKDNLLDSMNPTRFGLVVAINTSPDNGLFVNLLRNQMSELEKQLTENNFIINFSKTQFIAKPQNSPLNENVSDGKHKGC